jgi:hypothetical protein
VFKLGKVVIKLLFVMVDVLPYEIKELLQLITPSQNYDQFIKVAMTYKALKKPLAVGLARRMVDDAVIILSRHNSVLWA